MNQYTRIEISKGVNMQENKETTKTSFPGYSSAQGLQM